MPVREGVAQGPAVLGSCWEQGRRFGGQWGLQEGNVHGTRGALRDPNPQPSSQPDHLPKTELGERSSGLSLSSTNKPGRPQPACSRWYAEPNTWGPRKSSQLARSPLSTPSADPAVLKGPAERTMWPHIVGMSLDTARGSAVQAPLSDPAWANMLTFVQQNVESGAPERERERGLAQGARPESAPAPPQTVIQEVPSALTQGLLFELTWV